MPDDPVSLRRELEQAELALERELAKAAIDAAGLIDPTPISDAIGASMSLADGDFAGAALSIVSMVPYLGDAVAKTAKGARALREIARLRQRITVLAQRLRKETFGIPATKQGAEAVRKGRILPQKAPRACEGCNVSSQKKDFTPLGINGRQALATSEGEQLQEELRKANPDWAESRIKNTAAEILESGNELPKIRTVDENETLYKVVKKGEGPSSHTPFWLSEEELKELRKNPAAVADRLGLPQGSIASEYSVFSTRPKPGTSPKVFDSPVAKTIEGSIEQSGGGLQTIIPNRKLWTEPELLGNL